MCEMIRGGTTCFNDMYFHLPDAIDVFTPSGMRGVMGVPVFAFPSADGKCPEDYLKLSEDILTKYKDTNPLLTFTLAPHAPYTVPETLYQQAKAICDKYGISFVIASTPASSFIGVRPHAHSCPRDSG